MDAAELAVWQEDYLEQPWDLRTISEQLAMQMTLHANVNRNSKKRKQPYTLEDFLPGNSPRPEVPVETKAQRSKRLKSILLAVTPKRPKPKDVK